MSTVSDAAVSAALENVANVATEKTAEKAASTTATPSSWMTSVFRWTSYIFLFWILLLVVYILFSVYATWMFNSKSKAQNDSLQVKDLKKPNFDAVVFASDDKSEFVPKKTEEEPVQVVKSDKTVFDLLQGRYGPVIVLLYADWCVHCKTMMGSFEEAAKKSAVPFVKIEGQYAKQTLKHFRVEGFPTIYGVDTEGRAYPFVSPRTTEEFLSFAHKMNPEVSKDSDMKQQPAPTNIEVTELPEVGVARVEVLDEEGPKEIAGDVAANT